MAHQKKNTRFFGGLAVALVLPLSFFIIAKALKKDHIRMPGHYRPLQVTAPGDTVWATMPELRGINQVGEPVSLNEGLKGKVLAINFFFTECTDVCPKATSNVALIQRAFRRTEQRMNDTMVQLVSISVQPETDSMPRLRAYADRFGANPDRWWFVQAPKPDVYRYMRDDLKLAAGQGEGGADDFAHSQMIVLLDRNRRIRGYYDALDPVQIKKCADDIVLLALEKERKPR